MTTVYLETFPAEWLQGTPEEVRRANEILCGNWDILESHTIPAQKPESQNCLAELAEPRANS
jgi:hypothetical protein